jgi:hypothetical protein
MCAGYGKVAGASAAPIVAGKELAYIMVLSAAE